MELNLVTLGKQLFLASGICLVGIIAHGSICAYHKHSESSLIFFDLVDFCGYNMTTRHTDAIIQHKELAVRLGAWVKRLLLTIYWHLWHASVVVYKYLERTVAYKCPFIRALFLALMCLPFFNLFVAFVYFMHLRPPRANGQLTHTERPQLEAEQQQQSEQQPQPAEQLPSVEQQQPEEALKIKLVPPTPPPRRKRRLRKPADTTQNLALQPVDNYPVHNDPFTAIESATETAYRDLRLRLNAVLADLQKPVPDSTLIIATQSVVNEVKTDFRYRSLRPPTKLAKRPRAPKKLMRALLKSVSKPFKSTPKRTFVSYFNEQIEADDAAKHNAKSHTRLLPSAFSIFCPLRPRVVKQQQHAPNYSSTATTTTTSSSAFSETVNVGMAY